MPKLVVQRCPSAAINLPNDEVASDTNWLPPIFYNLICCCWYSCKFAYTWLFILYIDGNLANILRPYQQCCFQLVQIVFCHARGCSEATQRRSCLISVQFMQFSAMDSAGCYFFFSYCCDWCAAAGQSDRVIREKRSMRCRGSAQRLPFVVFQKRVGRPITLGSNSVPNSNGIAPQYQFPKFSPK